jgi:hypothetical protein
MDVIVEDPGTRTASTQDESDAAAALLRAAAGRGYQVAARAIAGARGEAGR